MGLGETFCSFPSMEEGNTYCGEIGATKRIMIRAAGAYSTPRPGANVVRWGENTHKHKNEGCRQATRHETRPKRGWALETCRRTPRW